MSHPIRNRHPQQCRTRLMLGCGSAALALAMTLAPTRAAAQGIQADGNVVFGSAEINITGPNETTVEVGTQAAVIDWDPFEDVNGDALDFIPTGGIAYFQDSPGQGGFALLNRILPSTNGNIAVIDGAVISRLQDVSGGFSDGGFVAFYSPTGFLIGDNATFDIGQLMLTTLNTTDASFNSFRLGGVLELTGEPGSTARIAISPGAVITATPENSFFAVVAADVQMLGTARINGSHAYVAGEVVNLSFSNGLFNIAVPVGTAASGRVVEVDGNVGGPASIGSPSDNHLIYGVAVAQNDPISMLFSGNLGFDPAVVAGVVNGEIILSANYNVFGRTVAGGTIADGIAATFRTNNEVSSIQADVFIDDFAATSSLLAISTHRVQATAVNTASSVNGNLLLVGRGNAELIANNAQGFVVAGDLLVDARDYGIVSSSLVTLDQISAAGGFALVDASDDAVVEVAGSALVTASAFGGADDLNRIAGTALGGVALISATGGTITIDGLATLEADAVGTLIDDIRTGAEARAGSAQMVATEGGSVSVGFDAFLSAVAFAAEGDLVNPSTVSNAFGGSAFISVFNGGGTVTIANDLRIDASARGGGSNTSGAGAIGDAGEATLSAFADGLISVGGQLRLFANGLGGQNVQATGGTGLGGRASAVTFENGVIEIDGTLFADAVGEGGFGQAGGDGFGGIAGANAITGTITIDGSAFVNANGRGGSAFFGFGGNGGLGRGGNGFLQANGTLTEQATLTIGGDVSVFASGSGGRGGATDGVLIPAGRGGDGFGGNFSVPNQADPAFTSGAFILAGGDNGTLEIGGQAAAFANGNGGMGGGGGPSSFPGRGGDGFGGLAQVGLALLGQNGSLGQGSATFLGVSAQARGVGGDGGTLFIDDPFGDGGDGTGGLAVMTVRAGEVVADQIELNGSGLGGRGSQGGLGTGGAAAVFGGLGGSLTSDQIIARANGLGGAGGADIAISPGGGGDGQGGEAEFDFQGLTVQVNGDVLFEGSGFGGDAGDTFGGDGIGGAARVGVLGATAGNGTITGNTEVAANGFGGGHNNGTGFQSGNGFGGTAFVRVLGPGTSRFATLQVMASGFGGEGEIFGYTGGSGIGGFADIAAIGAGSTVIVERNVTTALATDRNFGAILSSVGVGGRGTGGFGAGGNGRGGSVQLSAQQGGVVTLPADPFNDPDSVGAINLIARGIAGNTRVDGATGGAGFGGNGFIDVIGGTLTMGAAVLSVLAEGGTAFDGANNVTGGAAIGGSRRISVTGGGTVSLQLVGGASGAQGGDGTGTGNGGDVFAGRNVVIVDNSTLNITGELRLVNQSQGGDGQQGGNVFNENTVFGSVGTLSFTANNSTVNFIPDAGGTSAIVIGGTSQGGNGVATGGSAEAPIVEVTINGTNLVGVPLRINTIASGGNASAPTGIGGDALGSPISVAITDAQITLPGETLIAGDARGGEGGDNGEGGTAESGVIGVTVSGSVLNFVANQQGNPGILRVRSQAIGGPGGTVGDALSGGAAVDLAATTLNAEQLVIEATALSVASRAGQTGGDAQGGDAGLSVAGASQLTLDLLQINAGVEITTGGTGQGGLAALSVASGSTATIDAAQVVLAADGFVGDPATAANAGVFTINVAGGNVNADTLTASALGDVVSASAPRSELVANGGSLNVADVLFAQSQGDMLVRTGAGGIIGGPRAAATTTLVQIQSSGVVTIEGDNNAAAGLGGDAVSVAARDIEIASGARIAADRVLITSFNTDTAAILGGTAAGTGFTLTAEELGRISARELEITLPELVGSSDPNQIDALVRDVSLIGSAGQGFEAVSLFVGSDLPTGILRVEGTLSIADAGADDQLSIIARRIEVVTPGGIRVEGTDDRPGGTLALSADDVWIADAATITQLQTDRNFAGRDALLAAAASGSDDPLGYVRAGGMSISVRNSLLVRNTGVAFEGGGLLVGNGGLSISSSGSGQSGGGAQLDVFAYGRRQLPDGSFVTGEAFFDEVNFNRIAPGTTTYLDASAFNDCIINTGICPEPPPPPGPEVEPPPQINNPIVLDPPVQMGNDQAALVGEEDDRFGIEFPEQPDAALISEDSLLDDPVSSGGDASLYSGTANMPPGGA
jgi:hypothetical protein